MSSLSTAIVIKDALTGVDGINTVEIGLEPNLTPKDYPIIRIVPIDSTQGESLNSEKHRYDIFIGLSDKFDKDGYESIYGLIDEWEKEIKARLSNAGEVIIWRNTQHDEDKLKNVKVIVMRVEAV